MRHHNSSEADDLSTHPTRTRTSSTSPSSRTRRRRKQERKEEKEDERVEHFYTWPRFTFSNRHLKDVAKYCPLVAAILAPLSTLLDIPALTQRWYTKNGVIQPDPKASLVLSAIGLALNVVANVFLVWRFSAKSDLWWKHMTRWSLISWVGKTIVAAVNLILFGILTRNDPGYSYQEGFWCAIVSIIDAGVISIALLLHYFFAFGDEKHDNSDVRSEGKKFMLSVTFFFAVLAVQSLVFSRIEHWSYTDSLYGSVQTALTIGFGDFAPTTPAGKVLVFPFSVLTISQLGNEIALIISFISDRAEERRDKWRRRFEGAMHREANARRPRAGLTEEMALIHQINTKEEMMSQMYDLMWSAWSLIVFWVVGAALFSQIEGWTYGNAVYTCMILSLTIGFGDFEPVQPAGRVVFIVYALMAVPIVTSFAVQTITGLLSTYSQRGAAREAFLAERRRTPEAFQPHSDFILHHHESYGDVRKRLLGALDEEKEEAGNGDEESAAPEGKEQPADVARAKGNEGDTEGQSDDSAVPEQRLLGKQKADAEYADAKQRIQDDVRDVDAAQNGSPPYQQRPQMQEKETSRQREKSDKTLIGSDLEEQDQNGTTEKKDKIDTRGEDKQRQLEYDLMKQLMNRTIQLEAEARQMLLDSMAKGVARTLLLADRNVQIRDVKALRGDDANMLAIWQGEEEQTASDRSKADQDVSAGADNDQRTSHQQAKGRDNEKSKENDAQTGRATQTQHEQAKTQLDMLSRVRRYRDTFAEVLVLGSILQKLEGDELNRFERWRTEDQSQLAEEREEGEEDIHRVAEERWGGLTGKIFRRQATRLGGKELDDLV